MTVCGTIKILGYIIGQHKASNVPTLRDVRAYFEKELASGWEKKYSSSLTEVMIDINTLEREECIIVEEGEKSFDDKYTPTDYGVFTYVRLKEGNEHDVPIPA